jgi:rare lipoprotein A
MEKLKRKNTHSLFLVLLAAFVCLVAAGCESPRVVKHPVSRGDTYYYYVTFYGDEYNGRNMANGEPFSNDAMTCAAKGFPFGTVLEVQSLDTKKKVEVVVTDRPGKELIDLTKKAFDEIDNAAKGKIRAKIKVVGLAENAPKAAPAQASESEKSAEEENKTEPEEEKKEEKEPEKEAPKETKKEVFYAIVLAAFGNIDAAKNYQSGIKEDTYIFTSDGKYEVRYGRYTSKEDAKADINNFSWKDAEIVTIEE